MKWAKTQRGVTLVELVVVIAITALLVAGVLANQSRLRQNTAFTSAIDTLQQAVNANPQNPTYHYHLGMAYEKANNYAMAKKQLEYTLQVSPNYAQADEIRRVLAESSSHN